MNRSSHYPRHVTKLDETLFREFLMNNQRANRTLLVLILLCFATLEQPVGAQSPQAQTANITAIATQDEQAIRVTIARIEATWNTHDMKAYGELLTEDVNWVNVVGMHWIGHKAVMKAHAAFHTSTFKNHRIKTDSVEIRPIGRDMAIAVVTTTNDPFTTPDGSNVPKRQNRQSYVLRKDASTWKIAHGHNVAVDPVAARFNPVGADH